MGKWGYDSDSANGPSEAHKHLFTWRHCSAQVEKGGRIYRFGIIEKDEPWNIRVYCRRESWISKVWKSHDLTHAESVELLDRIKAVRLPILFEDAPFNSAHLNNALEIPRQGVSIRVWWDSHNSVTDELAGVIEWFGKVFQIFQPSIEEEDARMALRWSDDL